MAVEMDIYHGLHHIDKLTLILNISIFLLNFYELHRMYSLKWNFKFLFKIMLNANNLPKNGNKYIY